MAIPTRRAQHARERKRRKRAQARARRRRSTLSEDEERAYMRRAAENPVRECLMGYGGSGRCHSLLVARDGPGWIDMVLIVVDRGCRGLKDVWALPLMDRDEYRVQIDHLRGIENLRPISLDAAAKLVDSAAAYGASLGFRPHRKLRVARSILKGARPERCDEEFRFGDRDGRPCYVPDGDENPEPVLQRLLSRLGRDGFVYVPPFDRASLGFSSAIERPDVPGQLRFDGTELLADPEWRRLRVLQARMLDRVLDYATDSVHADVLHHASGDFDPGLKDDISLLDSRYGTWFLPWAAYAWQPYDDLCERLDDVPLPDRRRWPQRCLGLEFLAANRKKLHGTERRYLETVCSRPYSFYKVVGVERDRALALEDLLTANRLRVNEYAGTHYIRQDGIVYARVVPVGRHCLIESYAPLEIPADFTVQLQVLGLFLRDEHPDAADPVAAAAATIHEMTLCLIDDLEVRTNPFQAELD